MLNVREVSGASKFARRLANCISKRTADLAQLREAQREGRDGEEAETSTGPQALKANRRHPEALRPPDYMSTLIRPWWFQLTKNYARRIASELIHKGGLSADDAWAAAWPLAAEKATVEARVEESFLTTEELAATAPSQEYLAAEAPPGECPPPVDADEAERKLAYEEFRNGIIVGRMGTPLQICTMEPVDTVIYEIWESGKLRPPFGGKDFAFFAWDVRNAIRRALREVAKPGGASAFAGGDVARGGRAAMEALRGLMVMMGDEGLASSLSPNGAAETSVSMSSVALNGESVATRSSKQSKRSSCSSAT